MGLLTKLGKGQGYLKAGLLGFQASGKTYTATSLAIGLRKYTKHDGPIAMFDTEGGSEYIADRILKETGKELLGLKSQSFQYLVDMAQECEKGGVSVLIVDSVTHVWREICDSYLDHVNQQRSKKGLPNRSKLEFQDWNPIKKKWSEWTNFYLNSKLHIIICGRAGYEYDMDKNEETGQKELIKTGIRMKTETEFGFEPSLLVEMERVQVPQRDGSFQMVRHAKVIKDRFAVLDGAETDNPTFDFFLPHVSKLTPGAMQAIDTRSRTPMEVDEAGRNEFDRRKYAQKKAWEEIENGLALIYPSSQGKDKQQRYGILAELTGSTSETKIQELDPFLLERVALVIRELGKDILAGIQIGNVLPYVRHIFDTLDDRLNPVEPAGGNLAKEAENNTQQAHDAAPPFNPETCPPAEEHTIEWYCGKFRQMTDTAAINDLYKSAPQELKADIYQAYTEAMKGARGNK